jgi:DNA gyrase subunit B
LNEDSIPQLSPIEHVRRRPGMYFGGIDRRALHRLIDELLYNAVDQVLLGYCNRIEVILEDNNTVSVSDNGEGIPVHLYQDTGKRVLELVATQIGGRHYNAEAERFRGGGFGVGIAAVNAISPQMIIQVKRDGHLWEQSYSEGRAVTELTKVRALQPDERTGTLIRFTPDFTIFEPNTFSYAELSRKLRETSYLVPNTTLVLDDRRSEPEGARVEFLSPNGMADFVTFLNQGYTPLHPVIHLRQTLMREVDYKETGVTFEFEAAIQYTDAPNPVILSFANLWDTGWVGTHVESVVATLEVFVSHYADNIGRLSRKPYSFLREDITDGLTLAINLWHPNVVFEGSIAAKIFNPDIKSPIHHALREALEGFSEENPEAMRRITDNCLANRAAREKRRYGG